MECWYVYFKLIAESCLSGFENLPQQCSGGFFVEVNVFLYFGHLVMFYTPVFLPCLSHFNFRYYMYAYKYLFANSKFVQFEFSLCPTQFETFEFALTS